MNSTKSKISNKILSFIIALTYVVVATLYSFWATYNMVSDGLFYYLLLPATFVPSLIIFTEREPMMLVLVCQTLTLGVIYFLTWGFVIVARNENK